MNQYGYDGPNRHQFGGTKIPIPDSYFNPQFPQPSSPRYPQMQFAPRPPRSPPPFRFSPMRNQNNTTTFSPHRGQNNKQSLKSTSPSLQRPTLHILDKPTAPTTEEDNLVVDVPTDDMDAATVEVRHQAEDEVITTTRNGPEMVNT